MGRAPPDQAGREAAEAILGDAAVTSAAIAAWTGVPIRTVQRWRKLGAPGGAAARLTPSAWPPGPVAALGRPRRAEEADEQPALDGRRLRLALRRHLGRAIARCDAALRRPAGKVDSAKMLRDLTGLKRLLDEVEAGHKAGGTDAASRPAPDLPALRAGIARRYAAFAGERPAAGLPCEPAAEADPGPGR